MWGVSNNLSTICSNGDTILGGVPGFPVQISRIFNFSDQSPFFEVVVSLSFYKIDNWTNETVSILLNNETIFQNQYGIDTPNTSICGDPLQGDSIQKISARASVDSLLLNISINVNSILVLWGLKNFATSINRCAATCLTCRGYLDNECLSCYPFAVKNDVCSCLAGFFQVVLPKCEGWVCSYCQICDLSCKECLGPYDNNCSKCYDFYDLINVRCVR